jgi:hypothetical protein
MNGKIVLLIAGLVVGAAGGWLSAPAPALDLKIGPLSLEVREGGGEGGSMTATDGDGTVQLQIGEASPLDDRNTRTGIFALVGAIVGFAAGFVLDRRKA